MPTTAVSWTVRFRPQSPTAVLFGELHAAEPVARLSPDWLLGHRDEVCAAGLVPDPAHPELRVPAAAMRDLIATLDRCADEIVPRPDPALLAPRARRQDPLRRPRAAVA
jgi:hypothetical protein